MIFKLFILYMMRRVRNIFINIIFCFIIIFEVIFIIVDFIVFGGCKLLMFIKFIMCFYWRGVVIMIIVMVVEGVEISYIVGLGSFCGEVFVFFVKFVFFDGFVNYRN